MAIDSNQELYSSVGEIIDALQGLGAADLAQELRNALRISSLPGEILGEVRLALQRIRVHDSYRRLDVRRRVDDGIDYVNRVLGT